MIATLTEPAAVFTQETFYLFLAARDYPYLLTQIRLTSW